MKDTVTRSSFPFGHHETVASDGAVPRREAGATRPGGQEPSPLGRGVAVQVPDTLLIDAPDTGVYDVVILGAGCSGLSLCLALLEHGATGPILLVDSRTEYRDDRTWSFWDVEPTRFTHLARARWTTWRVATAAGRVRSSSLSTPYVSLAANDFYRHVLGLLAEYPNVRFLTGEDVVGYSEIADGLEVATTRFRVRGAQLVDSRGLRPTRGEHDDSARRSTWVPQKFVGWYLVSSRPVFDADECMLMDFSVDQTRGLRFGYVLPVSPNEALVENVYLADVPVSEAEHRAELESYVESRFGLEPGDYDILGDERGYIPMTDHVFTQRPMPRVSVIGTLGGATRPSTGYTFLRIQRSSDETALRLLGDSPDDGRIHTSRTSILDRVFLRFLADHPERAPLVFARMFSRVPAESLVRFLSDRSGPIDIARLILALPKRWFLGSALLVVLRMVADGGRHDRRT